VYIHIFNIHLELEDCKVTSKRVIQEVSIKIKTKVGWVNLLLKIYHIFMHNMYITFGFLKNEYTHFGKHFIFKFYYSFLPLVLCCCQISDHQQQDLARYGYRTILILPKHSLPIWDYNGVISRNILNAHFVPPHCLNRTIILNFVHHHFWPKLLQQLKVLIVIYID
jgi:hypothetical protein